ncbi:MAG: chemotaxis-specific protein-glutamate methyltransferase CheB [Chloroflexota bacterium]
MPKDHIRVLIAEDSQTIAYHLQRIMEDVGVLEVVGHAPDGAAAVQLAASLKPDVISMDVQMPNMDGMEATRHIMRGTPTPIVIVSSLVDREIDLSFRALQAGALAVVPKPPARTSPEFSGAKLHLTNTLRAMADVKVIRRWASVYEVPKQTSPRAYNTEGLRGTPTIIAIAASAGGPSALATLIAGLRSNLSVPVVVVQHMPGEFIGGLARWLTKFTERPVTVAGHRDTLQPGVIHLAPGDRHLRVGQHGGRFIALLDDQPGRYRHHPSADVLFTSVAQAAAERGVGIVLTGMGSDGAAGLREMYRVHARTFAQDETSATVFGMPKAAIDYGAAEHIMAPAQIAASLRKLL